MKTPSLLLLAVSLVSFTACGPQGAGEADDASPTTQALASAEGLRAYFDNALYAAPPESIDALRMSPWVSANFAAFEYTPPNAESPVAALDLHLENTHVTLLATDGSLIPLGFIGLGTATERAGALAVARGRLVAEFGAGNVQTTQYPNAKLHEVFMPGDDSSWVKQYAPASNPKTRKEIQAPFFDPQKLARDVLAVRVALPGDDANILRRELALLGWTVQETGAQSYRARSPLDGSVRRVISVRTATATRRGLQHIVFSLRTATAHQETFGNLELATGVNGRPVGTLSVGAPTTVDVDEDLASLDL